MIHDMIFAIEMIRKMLFSLANKSELSLVVFIVLLVVLIFLKHVYFHSYRTVLSITIELSFWSRLFLLLFLTFLLVFIRHRDFFRIFFYHPLGFEKVPCASVNISGNKLLANTLLRICFTNNALCKSST